MMPLTGVAVDESLTSNDEKKPDAFELAWKEHAGDVDDLADLPDKPVSKEKLPVYSKADPVTGELGDSLLMRNVNQFYQDEEDAKGIVNAREVIRDLHSRYSDFGGLEDKSRAYRAVINAIRTDPVMGAGAALEAYNGAKWRAQKAAATTPDPDLPIDGRTGRPFRTANLDRHISRSIEAVETGNHKLSREEATLLREACGGVSLEQALKMVEQFDREALASPIDAISRLAFSFGAPSTPRQHEQWSEAEGAKSAINQAKQAGIIPDDRNREIAAILQRPNFPDLGSAQANLQHAAQIDAHEREQGELTAIQREPHFQRSGDPYLDQQNAGIVRQERGKFQDVVNAVDAKYPADSPVGKEMARLAFKDPAFRELINQTNSGRHIAQMPYDLLQHAVRTAEANVSRRQSVAKAMKIRSVKSNSGPVGDDTVSRSSLDDHIRSAMSRYSFDD
jgi:hypothetical protein